ncbi:phosphatidate cytidylyltransferase [Oleiharenicola lentus]|jgi:phosphatidate cytidylyltransferase|uniref:Phosphatidate cytidylyltransferase n=1 Tax=Oleiharenicola lentus TaxID=2508720 RepID=A0A4Q1CCA3_9BACT|nr:phosphatidate cytidylyltransferase [Oleiharenicola lentus]RXK56744.1 phosphatidate cytidylyltransferase [Oleiharenicola lentus]
MQLDQQLIWILGGIIGLLALSSTITFFLKRRPGGPNKVVANLDARVKAWWAMVAVFGVALATGGLGSVILFGLLSFFALREFITLTPTRAGDHRTLFWAFFIITPLQYYLVAMEWYGLFSILIPVYAFIFVPTRSALAGDSEHFLERTAKIQWALMVCVYCVSHVPALLTLKIKGYEGQNAKLLLFFVIVVQISDVLQYVWGKLLGKRAIVPTISPNKTVEGFWGGILSATAVGAGLWWATPFTWWQAALFAFLLTLMGFFGGLVMSAIKRDRGVKDYGTMIEGHGGVMDRIDSLCFAAPVFFHLVRYIFT